MTGGVLEERGNLAASLFAPVELRKTPGGHAGEFGGIRRSHAARRVDDVLVGGAGAIEIAQTLVTEGNLIENRQAP